MSRLIEEQTAYDVLTDYYHHSTDTQRQALMDALSRVPTVDAVRVVHGRWKRAYLDHVAMGERSSIFYCSVCNQCIAYPVNYCPHCGAKMDGKDGDGNG